MHFQRAFLPSFLIVFLLSVAAMPGASQTPAPAMEASPAGMPAATSVVHGSQLIHVSECNPKLNVMQSGGYAGPGWAPGWGYRGAYWGDVYGAGFYQPPVTTADPQLGIHYKNISTKVMDAIEFGLIANGRLVAEVRDVGTFSPGAEIKHKFGLSPNVFPIQTSLPQCVPLRITFADGTKWRNPRLPPKNSAMYHPQPIHT